MKLTHSLIGAAFLLALTSPLTTTGAQTISTTAGSTTVSVSTTAHHAAPGPLVGAGPVGLVIGGVGYGVYWLVKRRRRKTHV
jgi:hypothetical protein